MPISTNNFQLLCILASLSSCAGVPLSPLAPRQDLATPPPTAPSGLPPSNLKPTVWVPVLAVSFILVAMVILRVFWKQRQYRRLQAEQRAAASRGEPIALTATQLAGSGTAGTDTQRRARRTRRPRRTPSQISTRSLPAYMESPGDQEIVLVRRREESLMEEDEQGSGHQRNISEATMQSDDEDERPLLNANDSQQNADHPSSPQTVMRQSHDSDHEQPADDRGAAPAYLEVAESDEAAARRSMEVVPSAADNNNPSTTNAPTTTPPRRSAFWRFVTPWSSNSPNTPPSATSPNPTSPTETRPGTSMSTAPLLHTPGHRSSLSLSATISGTSSNSNRNSLPPRPHSRIHRASASITSLLGNRSPPPPPQPASAIPAISLPVPTSVTRTQFQYPPNGVLTPEQMTFVSSTQSLIRFGVPYGEGASLSPPNYTVGTSRRGGSIVSFGIESELMGSSVDLASGRPRGESESGSSHVMAASPLTDTSPMLQDSNPSQISLPRSLDPVPELPTPVSPDAPSLADQPNLTETADSHRRVSSSTMNTFATAHQDPGEDDDDDTSSVAQTEGSSAPSRSSRLSTTTVESLPSQGSSPLKEVEFVQPPQVPVVSMQ